MALYFVPYLDTIYCPIITNGPASFLFFLLHSFDAILLLLAYVESCMLRTSTLPRNELIRLNIFF